MSGVAIYCGGPQGCGRSVPQARWVEHRRLVHQPPIPVATHQALVDHPIDCQHELALVLNTLKDVISELSSTDLPEQLVEDVNNTLDSCLSPIR